jgi:hypothetical protein
MQTGLSGPLQNACLGSRIRSATCET